MYSLGILLLEVGFWCPIGRIYQDCGSSDLKSFTDELKKRYVPTLSGRMGKAYTQIVSYCLEGKSGGIAGEGSSNGEEEYFIRMGSFLEEFERQVVVKIEGLVMA